MKGQSATKPQGHKPKQEFKRVSSNPGPSPGNPEEALPADWSQRWWRDCSLFSLDPSHCDYLASPRPELEKAFAWFWEPNRIAAWAYELVRRLVNTQTTTQPEKDALLKMPPYPQLDSRCREAVKAVIGEIYGWGTVLINRDGLDLRSFNYSEPIPPWSFDLRAGETAQLAIVRHWLRHQTEAIGVTNSPDKQQKKSRNQTQTGKLGDWDLVEVLDQPPQTNPDRRKRALGHAKKFKARILGTWLSCQEDTTFLCPALPVPNIPSFTERQFKKKQFMKLFAVETSRFPVPNAARAEGSASKRAKHREPIKSAGTAGESLSSDHITATPAELEEARQLLKTKSWPSVHGNNQENAAYKLGQLAALKVALGEKPALSEIPKGMLTDRDVLIVLEDLLLKSKITPYAAQAIIQKLMTCQAG